VNTSLFLPLQKYNPLLKFYPDSTVKHRICGNKQRKALSKSYNLYYKGNTMKKIFLLSTVAAIAVLPQFALAAYSDMYISGAAGINAQRNSQLTGGLVNDKAEFDNGWTGVGAVGYRFSNGLRSELELSYRDDDIDNVARVAGRGSVNSWGLMGNVLYDFHLNSPITPYIGVGAGALRIEYNNVGRATPTNSPRVNDTDYVGAIQGIAGVSYALNENFSLFTNYQYLVAFNPEFSSNGASGTSVDADYRTHTFLLGVRYNFGGVKPVILHETAATTTTEKVATAQTAPERTFLVFFDFNKAVISPEARKILEEAAANAHKTNVIRVSVTGHTDRSGSNTYNQHLSEKRAAAVKKALLQLGITDKEIVTVGKGESEPLVATDDGVREPQNRRVEIVYTAQ
jgi:OOP family OmpA-OmpF porin